MSNRKNLPKPSSNKLSVLHLSDLHYGLNAGRMFIPQVRRAVLDDFSRLAEKTDPWDVVVFSGDLVQSGAQNEFDRFTELLGEFWLHFGKLGMQPCLFPVPGNHDLSRPHTMHPASRALSNWNGDGEIRRAFWDKTPAEYFDCIQNAFSNYSAWLLQPDIVKILPEKRKNGLIPGDISAELDIRGHTLGLIGLNSAWLQISPGDFQGKLAISTKQFFELVESEPDRWCSQHDTNLLISHHPKEWLNAQSIEEWRGDIFTTRRFDAHLFGHMHEPNSLAISEGGAPARLEIQASSLFGLEHYGENLQRIHGYSLVQFWKESTKKYVRQYPRRAIKSVSGEMKLAPNHQYELVNESLTEEYPTCGEAVRISETISLQGNSKSARYALESLRRELKKNPANVTVRQSERTSILLALKKTRAAWIAADWGQDVNEQIRILQDELLIEPQNLFRIDCSSYSSLDDLLEGTKSSAGVTFEQLCDAIASQPNCIVFFDDVVKKENSHFGNKFSTDLESIIKAVLDYCENAYVVARSSSEPLDISFPCVIFEALDEAETLTYIKAHSLGGSMLADPLRGRQIYSITSGIPARIDAALRDIQIVGIDQIQSLNVDVAGKTAATRSAPRGVSATVNNLRGPGGSSSADELLSALAVFPHGEHLRTVQRFRNRCNFTLSDASLLLELGLIESVDSANLSNQDEPRRLLVVKRVVRDYIFEWLEKKDSRKLNDRAIELYFGDEWLNGKVKQGSRDRFDDALCSSWKIGNAITLILRALHDALEIGPAIRARRVFTCASTFGSLLRQGAHHRAIVSFWGGALPFIDASRLVFDGISIARLQYAQALRRAGDNDRAIILLNDVIEQLSSREHKQSALVSLALAQEHLPDSSNAKRAANECIKIGKKSTIAMHAKAILLRIDEDNLSKEKDLLSLEEAARKRGAMSVANNLAINRARKEKNPAVARSALESVLAARKQENDSSKYDKMRAYVQLAKLTIAEGGRVSTTELNWLVDAYHYLYSENFEKWFDECHDALWRTFLQNAEVENLLNLFRHSSLIWRIRGQGEQEKKCIVDLSEQIAQASIEMSKKRELSYFERRSAELRD